MPPSDAQTADLQARAQKALETRRRNQLQEELENRRLVNDVALSGGRSAKKDAMNNAVWKGGVAASSGRKDPEQHSETVESQQRVPPRLAEKRTRAAASGAASSPDEEPVAKPAPKKSKVSTAKPAAGGQGRRGVTVAEDDEDAAPAPAERSRKGEAMSEVKLVKGKHSQRAKATSKVVLSEDDLSDAEDENLQGDSGSEQEGQAEEDDDLKNLSDAQLRLLLKQESAYVAGDDKLGLWDVPEDDVEMVSRPQSRSSSNMSIDDEEDIRALKLGEEAIFPKGGKSEAGKSKSRRQQAFEDELPQIKTAGAGPSEDAAPVKPMRQWPVHARLVDNGARLQDQPDLIRLVVTTTIKRETMKILIDNAWPAIGLREQYCQRAVTAAAKEHTVEFEGVQDIIRRLERDLTFARILGNIALNRFSTTRSPVKTHAVNQIAAYELGTGPKCKERVEVLLQEDRYVFPGQWLQQQYMPQADAPYHHPAIIETLKAAFFQTPSSIGYRAVKEFNDSLVDAPKLIMPPAMAALAATGVFAAILEWETGRHKSAKNFEGNHYSTVYRSHLSVIESVKVESERAYYGILSTLYELVTGSEGTIVQQQPSALGLRGILDLSKYKE